MQSPVQLPLNRNKLYFSSITASLASFLFGFNISVMDAPKKIFVNCKANQNLLPNCVLLTERQYDLAVSLICIGALIGSLTGGSMADEIGRKRMMQVITLFYFIGLTITGFSWFPIMILFGRFLTGIGIGLTTVVVPNYLTEISPTEIRGTIGTFHQLACVIGILSAQFLAIFFAFDSWWRFLFFIGALVSLTQFFLLINSIESPKFVSETNLEEALRLQVILKGVADPLEFQETRTTPKSFNQLVFETPAARKSLLVGIMMHLGQQLSGINGIFYYSTSFFENLAVSSKVMSFALGILNLIMTLLSVWLMDRAGRRLLVISSSLLMSICSFLLVYSMYYELANLKAFLVLMFVASFAIGLGPVPWLILNEIFPKESIASASAIAVSVNWSSNFLIANFFTSISESLKSATFLVFGSILVLFSIFCFHFVIETRGRSVSYI